MRLSCQLVVLVLEETGLLGPNTAEIAPHAGDEERTLSVDIPRSNVQSVL